MINKATPIPLYYQVMEDIKAQIEKGKLRPGDKLPTESWLMQQYDVSRVTVRKAMSELIAEGVLETKRRRGNYVASKHVELPLTQLMSLHRVLKAKGINPTSRILSVSEKPASEELAEIMQVAPDEELIMLQRIRLADDEPISEQTTYLCKKYFKNFDVNELQNRSLYDILEHDNGIKIGQAFQTFYAKDPTKEEMENLRLIGCEPLLCINSRMCDRSGDTIEYSVNYYVTSRYTYSLSLAYT